MSNVNKWNEGHGRPVGRFIIYDGWVLDQICILLHIDATIIFAAELFLFLWVSNKNKKIFKQTNSSGSVMRMHFFLLLFSLCGWLVRTWPKECEKMIVGTRCLEVVNCQNLRSSTATKMHAPVLLDRSLFFMFIFSGSARAIAPKYRTTAASKFLLFYGGLSFRFVSLPSPFPSLSLSHTHTLVLPYDRG